MLWREAIQVAMAATNQVVGPVIVARSQRTWLQAVENHPDFLLIRRDGQRNLVAVTRVIMWRAWRPAVNPGVWLSRPTNDRIMQLTGLKQTSCKRWRAWLRERGFLGTVTEGSTPATRGGADSDHDGGISGQGDGADNLAAEYVLLVPLEPERPRLHRPLAEPFQPPGLVEPGADKHASCKSASSRDESRPPLVVLSLERTTSHFRPIAGAHEPANSPAAVGRTEGAPCVITGGSATALEWPLTATPGTRAQMLLAAEALRAASGLMRRLSARHLRSLLREFFACGWTAADVLWALDHRPDGSDWTFTDAPAFVPGWARFRLGWWQADGAVLPSRAQRAEQAAAVRRMEQQARRQAWQLLEQETGESSPWRSTQVSAVEDFVAPVRSAVATEPSAVYRAVRARMEQSRRDQELAMVRALAGRA
ncbi:hypothetical protein ACIBH1_47995 [Nonomuraea sp. NPDC050663]|uniref:hypothetical protein n=1 Tax=Nonomuraea sp. NPDC050663 TaxID=3364370 RepID=UPI003795C0F9